MSKIKSKECFDVVIIGAGPAGLAAATALNNSNLNILIIEKGSNIEYRKCTKEQKCNNCLVCAESSGVGGVGGYSDGKLCLGPVGIDDALLSENYEKEAQFIAEMLLWGQKIKDIKDDKFHKKINDNMTEEATKVIKMGSEYIRKSFQSIFDNLKINKLNNTSVESIKKENELFLLKTSEDEILAKNIIVATGKSEFKLKE